MAKIVTCKKCGKDYPRTPEYFQRCKGKRDGLRAECKLCSSKYQAERYRLRTQGRKKRKRGRPSHFKPKKGDIFIPVDSHTGKVHHCSEFLTFTCQSKEKILLQATDQHSKNKPVWVFPYSDWQFQKPV